MLPALGESECMGEKENKQLEADKNIISDGVKCWKKIKQGQWKAIFGPPVSFAQDAQLPLLNSCL